MHRRKIRLLSAFLAAALFAGGIPREGISPSYVRAAHIEEEKQETDSISQNSVADFEGLNSLPVAVEEEQAEDGRWYVLGRPMTEAEHEEQISLTRYYNSFTKEIQVGEIKPEDSHTEDLGAESGIGLLSMDVVQTADIPRQYSSVTQGHTPAIRDQGALGTCWVHTAMACVEISMIKNGIIDRENCDMSENHLIYYRHRPVVDPLNGTEGDYDYAATGNNIYQMYNSGSTIATNWGTLAAWMGPVPESPLYEYDYLYNNHFEPTQGGELNTVEKAYGNRQAILTEFFSVPLWKPMEVKKAIMTYGAVGTHYNAEDKYYNPESAAHYCYDSLSPNHAVAIVGWDDNFSRENFEEQPEHNGAWLARNSWGTDWGDEGYFWISYDDESMSGINIFNTAPADKYDNNYHYDRAATDIGYISASEGEKIEGSSIFEIQKEKELLKAVQFHLMYSNLRYSIQIYKLEGNQQPDEGLALLDKPLEGGRAQPGHYTVDLAMPIELSQGDKIAVCITYFSHLDNVSPAFPRANYDVSEPGQSMYRKTSNGEWGEWTDCKTEGNLVIRAFTSDLDGEESENHQHQWESKWSYNDTHHWHDCMGSGSCTATDTQERAHGEHEGGTAYCNARAICTTCNKPYGNFDPEVHGSSQVRVNVVEATPARPGYSGDVECYGCGFVFEEGKEVPYSSEIPGVDNLDVTFKGLDDSLVSSTVGEKPKMIMFYGAKCYHCIDTLYELTTNKVEGVDICAVEVNHYGKHVVQDMIDTKLGQHTDYITFCYDESYDARQIKTRYEEAFNNMTSSSLPVIFYIDEYNKIRHMTSGTQSSKAVKQNLAMYCNMTTKGLDKDNPSSLEFTSFEGEAMSMTADGKPKMLVFYQTNGNSTDTLASLASEELEGVDIYAIDTWHDNIETGKSYIEGIIGSDSHIKTTGKSDEKWAAMQEYLRAAGEDPFTTFEHPVICYLDGDNKLQYLTTGKSDLNFAKMVLMLNCGYRPESGDGGAGNEGDNGNEGENGDEGENPKITDFTLTVPGQRTYFVGESINTTGGKLSLSDGQEIDMEVTMLSVSTFSREGEIQVDVTYKDITKQFTVLAVAKPAGLTGIQDEALSSVALPQSDYGTFSWSNGGEIMTLTGEKTYTAIFTPNKSEYAARNDLQLSVNVQEKAPVEPPVDPTRPEFRVEEIEPLTYTGKPLKPLVAVYDGDVLLKVNKDYTLSYKNNINAGGLQTGEDFSDSSPQVIIKGKGNYTGTIVRNFSILPVQLATEDGAEAEGVTLNYSNNLAVNRNKEQAVLKNLKVKKVLKSDVDYTVTLTPREAIDASGAALTQEITDQKIPAGSSGSFTLSITGKGNYVGTISTTIWVAEKEKLLNQAKITLGKNLKKVDLTYFKNELQGELAAGYYDSESKAYYVATDGIIGASVNKNDIFTVKTGKAELMEGRDYTVSYRNTEKVGTATLTITGMGEYAGSKSITFKLAGKVLKASTVTISGITDQYYTGKPIIQENMTLTYDGESKSMEINRDYTVEYSNNTAKGIATITILAIEDSGYQGSFKKTFKIQAQPITQQMQEEGTKDIVVEYQKEGAKPAAEVLLTNGEGIPLVHGKDFTLRYKNHKQVAEKNGRSGPYMVVTGKGNYIGTIEIPFSIKKASLMGEKINISISQVAYNGKKADNYEYKPAVIIKNDGKALSSKRDFKITYENNTQKAYKEYYYGTSELPKELSPRVKIEAAVGSNYELAEPVYRELPIYQNKLSSKNLHVVISDISYTGSQLVPEVQVYYAPGNNAISARGITKEEEILALGLEKLKEEDYQLEYGTNILTGKNKGIVKVTGGTKYGGTVSFKFNISPRQLAEE